jgi:hypothetical protein
MGRKITSGEETLLRKVFGDTLPYGILSVDVNTDNLGGVDNSITPGNTPFMSPRHWHEDYSAAGVPDYEKSNFIHEFVHVWQFYHGITKLSAITLAIWHLGDYKAAYPYDLSDSDDLTDFNIEQQAAIIEDRWRIISGMQPRFNIGKDRSRSAYDSYEDQLRNSGPPLTPLLPRPGFRH